MVLTKSKAPSARGGARLQVLVVDDSAVVRQVLQSILTDMGGMDVTVAPDPLFAMNKMKKVRPDVIVLDLEMPRMDGLTFLKKLQAEDPIPVVVCSSLAGNGTDAAIRALEEGAVDVVAKPRLGVRDFLEDAGTMLVDTVWAAARVKRPRTKVMPKRQPPPSTRPKVPGGQPKLTADAVLPPVKARVLKVTTDKVIALGASTGGTEALSSILTAMPVDSPGVVVVQHMPERFTTAFANRLNQICEIEVKEAEDGDRVVRGRALIAPGNKHVIVRRNGAQYMVRVVDGPLVSRHRPSVDVLFRSVAQEVGPNAVGAILTGMGDDGAEGMLEMHQAGSGTIAQNEATCVVFGMPKEAIERGAVDEVVALNRILQRILERTRSLAR